MTKEQLETNLAALRMLQQETNDKLTDHKAQISLLEKQLADLNKPKLTPLQFDELREAINEGIGNWDFDDQDNYSIDFGIDYDNRVNCESFSFDNADDLSHEIYEYVARLFAEAECPTDKDETDEKINS